MISKKEFIIGLVIMFVLFIFVNGIIVSDINETMRTLKRPVVLHDTTSIIHYVDRYIHDTTVITKTKTEYIEKVSLSGRMQDYSEEKDTPITIETDGFVFERKLKYVKFQCNGKLIPDKDGDLEICAGDWVITAKEIIE